ncbi:2Fe-2S iron-sulfur cluster binding domain-containing protein [Halorubrum sp. Atlit-26R]|uniref:2Fe-2S iron-sulfur cluster binding domain-containing protein n=1 Tax=Halorubrum sp. Atlit-26R TaxID=2282128 RepID=UPI000EF1F7C8|nr:2Fe-2S iron-sulfur cluster binding domain-containing protein [Halorubrum sp. Atlit-26R]RLM76039.1 (2Fe-2S)-binding protein [Halorubrum sp. Atlit-26R]
MTDESETVRLTVVDGDERVELDAERGRNLRRVLLDAGLSPYAPATRRLNCGGRGLCATCGVRVREGPPADHWHDHLADRFGYPRLSCQIAVDRPMTVALVDKRVWGGRRSDASDGGAGSDDR